MAQGGGGSTAPQVWVWCPTSDDKDAPFLHPSDVPANEEDVARARFIDKERGPRIARISPATLLQQRGNMALIAERGATREVPKLRVLQWYEGLLLLEELEGSQGQDGRFQASWFDGELKKVLDTERSIRKLSSSLYTEKRLVNTAVTGSHFVDSDDKEWSYRRENLRGDEKVILAEGETAGSFFKIREISDYLPPWEAFCHERCGFYQDFYLVRWEYPFSEVDYSRVENGCKTTIGATWEPDECLPAHLDPLRLAAKRAWIKKRREQERQTEDEKRREKLAVKRLAPSPEEPQPKVKEEREETRAPLKRARTKRDLAPLDRDLFQSAYGHDFEPGDIENVGGGIRKGWPKNPDEYPKGYGVANPPGFCWEGCDCMDDQRPQRPWETTKAWLEEPMRSAAAQKCIEGFSAQTSFVRQRGQVSKMWFFETGGNNLGDTTHSQAAVELAAFVESTLKEMLTSIPINMLKASNGPLHIPAVAFLPGELDYEPLCFEAMPHSGGQLPSWTKIEMDDGRLHAPDAVPSIQQPLKLDVVFTHAEGRIGTALCSVTGERPGVSLWAAATIPVVQRFADLTTCPLEPGVRAALAEQFSEIYDLRQRTVRDKPLGEWITVMARILRMLRSAAITNISLAPQHNSTSFGLAHRSAAPWTPPKK